MPGRGARLDRGIEEAIQLLDNAQTGDGRIVLVVDQAGEEPSAAIEAAERAADAGYTVSVVALTDQDQALREVAEAGGGVWTLLRPDDSDIREVLMAGTGLPGDLGSLRRSQAEADVWRDMGAWLVLIPLALAPLAFRRGWAGSLLVFALLGSGGTPAQAGVVDWFRTADQQGAAAFEAGEHDEAAQRFEDPEWQAAARYREANYEAAVEALSELDSARAQYNLGWMYANERGVPRNTATAAQLYTLAAEQGLPVAQNALAAMYESGTGVAQDYKTAAKWYRAAARQGFARAQFNLGVMHDEGKGIPRNDTYAHVWYNIVASSGDRDAIAKRDAVAKRMTRAEIAKAQFLARECIDRKFNGCPAKISIPKF